jgi:hypothetical protein
MQFYFSISFVTHSPTHGSKMGHFGSAQEDIFDHFTNLHASVSVRLARSSVVFTALKCSGDPF